MNAYKRMLLAGFCAGSTILAFGSQAQAAKAASPKVDKTSAAIAAYADELVIPTYKTMSDNALKFAKAAKELKAAPTDAKVAEAGKLLLETRVPWELSESFLFGPAAFANLDPKLDSWPLDTTNLDAVAKNADSKSVTIDAAYVRAQLLERLSYGIGQPADASAITAMVKEIAPNGYVDSAGVSNVNSGYIALKATTGVNYQWATAAVRIYINGSHG